MGRTSARLAGGVAALVLAGAASGTAIAQDAPRPVAPDPAAADRGPESGAVVLRPDPPPEATSAGPAERAMPIRRPAVAAPAPPAAPAMTTRPPAAAGTTTAAAHVARAVPGRRVSRRHRALHPVPAPAPSFARAAAPAPAGPSSSADLGVPRALLAGAGAALLLAAAGGAAGLRRGAARLRP